MQKRIQKPENNVQKVFQYVFTSIVTWCLFSVFHASWNYQKFGFWGFVLIYSAGLSLGNVVLGAAKEIYSGAMKKMTTTNIAKVDET